MSLWSQRKQKIAKEMDYDPLTVIPDLLESSSRDVALNNLEAAFANTGANQIIIVDPYLQPRSIQMAVNLFAKRANREVVFLTRMENGEGGSALENKSKIRNAIEEIMGKGIFRNIVILRTSFDFHDRYIVSREGKGDDLYLLVNTSLSSIYTKYSGTVRINNRSYRRQIDDFINKAIEESKDWLSYE
ncbi:hypothetical protein [Halomonas piscis]|uniref:hypothetical protein n=1 Tax=Halomonas piscis TaxID=3031727 RepID=UPI00289BA042|nr:hypothetical protein [Halomonas piscis]